MSLFSAIITTRNRKELLEKAIESVLSQTVKDVECVVVDDASEDGTKETYEKDPRIVYVRIDAKDSRGGNYARNQGIAHATGEFLTFLDDDDTWASDKLEKQLALYQKSYRWKRPTAYGDSAEKVYGRYFAIDPNDLCHVDIVLVFPTGLA